MSITSSQDIREAFLSFFGSHGHTPVPSSSLIPADDPTLLFTNAGMVQFKQVFLGQEKRDYTRATSCQKCVRAGGKHNDLENVGYTARHHTFFEMLGNFSFGDYFKEEAIAYAWEFLTNTLGLPRDLLWVTVFEEDDEAAALWPRVTGIDPNRVVRLGEKDNFWAMGDTGPCGPCSEILIDQGKTVGCGTPNCKVGCDCDRFLELWNLVFMQFYRDPEGNLSALPKPSIDTGMGLERISAICQGKLNNFDTDLFTGIFHALSRLCGREYGGDKATDVAMRIIADHARASTFLIADGIVPSNEGRGFVLRRIIRRAARYGRVLGLKDPFISEISKTVIAEMGAVYPEISRESAAVQKVIRHEEERFLDTLEHGLQHLEEEIRSIKAMGGSRIPGEVIFKLYDTFGFPVDILRDRALEEGLKIDQDGFEALMKEQRKRSRSRSSIQGALEGSGAVAALVEQGIKTSFTGYDSLTAEGKVLLLTQNGEESPIASPGWEGQLIADTTPFYGESGGQVGDQGVATWPGGEARVMDATRTGDLTIHHVKVISGTLKKGDRVTLQVNEGMRADTARNHTATHLLHTALRQVLGQHVKQAGSLVTPQRLRFDFNHFSAMDTEQLRQVEDLVNQAVRADQLVKTEVVPYKEAIAKNAMALFGERYGDQVRVVEVPGFSIELCGGTHVARTGQIGFFKLLSESSVASGVRRIEAVTGSAAVEAVHGLEELVLSSARALKCSFHEVPERIEAMTARIRLLDRELKELKTSSAEDEIARLIEKATEIKGVKVVSGVVTGGDIEVLRSTGDRIRDRLKDSVVVLGTPADGKALLVVMCAKEISTKLPAGQIIKKIAPVVGGGGGGRPHMAQAGGPKVEKLEEAVTLAPKVVEELLS